MNRSLSRKRIAFIIPDELPGMSPAGGIGVFVDTLSRGLIENGFNCSIIVIGSKRKDVTDKPYKVICINTNCTIRLIAIVVNQIKTQIHLWKERYCLVEISTSDNFFQVPLIHRNLVCRTHGARSIVTKYGIKKGGRLDSVLKTNHEFWATKCSRKIIAISKLMYEHYSRFVYKMVYIPNFANNAYSLLTPKTQVHSRRFIFYHGTLKRIKGIIELAEAVANIQKHDQDLDLIVAGKNTNYDDIQSFSSYLVNILGDRVKYLGEINDPATIKPYLRNADVCVYPSHIESFGLTIIEAMGQEGLVLCSDIIDAEIIKQGYNGFRFNTQDKESLLENLRLVLYNLDSCKKAEIRRNAYNTFHEKFSIEIGVVNNVSFYSSVI